MISAGVLVLSTSLLLQSIAAFYAFRLIKLTGKRPAWVLISLAISLMVIRRSIPLGRLLAGDLSYLPDLPNELIGVLLSALMVAGAAMIAPLFLSIKQSEEALRQSKEWLSTTLRSIGDAVLATDTHGIITFMNPIAQHLLDLKDEVGVGKPLSKVFTIIDEQTGEPKEDPVARVLRKKEVVGLDNHSLLITSQGTKIAIDDSAAPIKDKSGNIVGVVLVFRDISPRKQAEEELKLAHQELKQIFNTAADGMRVIDPDFWVTKINERFVALLGLKEEEILGQKCFEIFPGSHCHTKKCSMRRILDGEDSIENDVIKKRPNGEEITCIMRATPLRRSNGELVGIVENFKDISERIKAEETLRQSEIAKADRQRLFAVLDVLPAVVYLQSPDFSIPFANHQFRKVFGHPEGKRCYEILFGFGEPCYNCRIFSILDKKDTQKWDLTSADGRSFEMYNSWFTDIDNSLKVLAMGIDNTDRLQMEKARLEAERLLEDQRTRAIHSDRLRSLGEMVTGMAHELNSPLLGVRGLAEHILIGLNRGWKITEATIREKIQLIIDQSDRMSYVIDHARRFARGADQSELTPVQVNEVIQASMQIIGVQLRFRGFVLANELAENLPLVLANPFSLEEVLLNIINNARDALKEKMEDNKKNDSQNRAVPHILVRTFEEQMDTQAFVKIEVIDQGVGIPSAIMAKVFEPFFTTKAPDKGTGLGLAISKSLIESFRGTITLQSSPGQGTTVTITLPALTKR